MIKITEIWPDPAPAHQIISDPVTVDEEVSKEVGKTLVSPFFMGDNLVISLNTRIGAGLGAIGNAPVNSIVIDGPEEIT